MFSKQSVGFIFSDDSPSRLSKKKVARYKIISKCCFLSAIALNMLTIVVLSLAACSLIDMNFDLVSKFMGIEQMLFLGLAASAIVFYDKKLDLTK